MATEIRETGPESPPSYSDAPKKEGAITESKAADLEGSIDDESKESLRDRAEATELTPAEAFRWNVEGDQSPCRSFRLPESEYTC